MPAPQEDVIEPGLEICDPHHHLWDLSVGGPAAFPQNMQTPHYLLPELLADLGKGHNVTSTVYVTANSFYRTDGPEILRPIGETEFANGISAMSASGRYGPVRACAGLVVGADLSLGPLISELLEAHIRAAGGRLKGIRQSATYDATGTTPVHSAANRPPPSLLLRQDFRAGFAQLGKFGLSFDAWLYHPQLHELVDLARSFPEQTIILDHIGGPLGVGAYAGRRDEVFQNWRDSLLSLATCPNIYVKLGGLGMFMFGFDFDSKRGVSSMALAKAWAPYLETCIAAFGVERCMFESNFPVDGYTCDYRTLWNVFKTIASGSSESEKAHLFRDTAVKAYRLSS